MGKFAYVLIIPPLLIKKLRIQKHTLAKIEEIFASLNDGKVFSKIDFSQAYLKMRVHPDS